MDAQTIREAVRNRYGKIAEGDKPSCCVTSCCGEGTTDTLSGSDVTQALGYSEKELANLPEGADLGLGCGHPTGLAELKEGETVLDLGSGAGIDVFLAADRVGPEGHVIGVDMTPTMVERARSNAATAGRSNVEFRLGEIEALPVSDDSVDVVISNCVLNLSANREQAFREAFRVLRPGGRVMISDMLSSQEAPRFLADSLDALVGCLPVQEAEYLAGLEATGFRDVRIVHERPYPTNLLANLPVVHELLASNPDWQEGIADFASSVRGALVHAVKPE